MITEEQPSIGQLWLSVEGEGVPGDDVITDALLDGGDQSGVRADHTAGVHVRRDP